MVNGIFNIISKIRMSAVAGGASYDQAVEDAISYAEFQLWTLPNSGRLQKLSDLVSIWKGTTGSWTARVVIWVPYTDNNAADFSRIPIFSNHKSGTIIALI